MDNAENGGWLGQAVPLDTIYAQQSENKCKKHVEKTRVSDPHLDGSGFFRRSGSGPLKPGFIRFLRLIFLRVFYLNLQFLAVFFIYPDPIRIFFSLQILIWTQGNKFDPDPDLRNHPSETLEKQAIDQSTPLVPSKKPSKPFLHLNSVRRGQNSKK